MRVPIKLHANDLTWMPKRSHLTDAGFDLKARAFSYILDGELCDCQIDGDTEWLLVGERILVRTGVYLGLLPGWEAQVRPRSGLALKYGLTIVNSPGTIDAGYRDEVGVILCNMGMHAVELSIGMRIAQLVIKEVPKVELTVQDSLDQTNRGMGGYGSSGYEVTETR